jgi:hypothetical protein
MSEVSNISETENHIIYEDFERRVDKNPCLMALSNCVLEVVNEEKVIPRPGKPEDFITKTSKIKYPFDYTEEHPNVKAVQEWFDKITLKNEELKHYMFKRFASFLRKGNKDNLFDIWIGENSSGKSTLIKTLQYIFGSYVVDFPTSLLAREDNGKANPEIFQAINCSFTVLQVPDCNVEICCGRIRIDYNSINFDNMIRRLILDERKFNCRCKTLNESNHIRTNFKTVMVTNYLEVDPELKKHICYIPFLGVYTNDAPEDTEEQFKVGKFKIEENFDCNIPELAKGLLWIMVKYYEIYVKEKLEPPKIIESILEDLKSKNKTESFELSSMNRLFNRTECEELQSGVIKRISC